VDAVAFAAHVVVQSHTIGMNVFSLEVNQSELSAAYTLQSFSVRNKKAEHVLSPTFQLTQFGYVPMFAGGKAVGISNFFADCFLFASRQEALSSNRCLFIRHT
jgi:hypothetical protein